MTPEHLAEIEARDEASAAGDQAASVMLSLHAHRDVPALLAEVKRLTDELDEAREDADRWRRYYKDDRHHVEQVIAQKTALEQEVARLRDAEAGEDR